MVGTEDPGAVGLRQRAGAGGQESWRLAHACFCGALTAHRLTTADPALLFGAQVCAFQDPETPVAINLSGIAMVV